MALLLVLALPAYAITYGEPDGTAHPFVGAIVLRIPGVGLIEGCSGTLIADNTFLTAAHCVSYLDSFLAANPGSDVRVTFDPTISEGGTYYTGQWHAHPQYNEFQGAGGKARPNDVAVIVLDEAPHITPAQLPSAGMLDELKAAQVLKDTRFTAVGYGAVRETNRTGFAGILSDNLDRNRSEQGYLALTDEWLQLPMNSSTGNGGTCYGDSGGPHFIHIDGAETHIVASITSYGDAPCKATDTTVRVDTELARSFLAQYVTLP